jgi:tripartite-type tricarboxylate transporter receptor subunit TctC
MIRSTPRSGLARLLAAAALACAVAPAGAQPKYPDKPIRLVVPFAPGGETDLFGRMWATRVGPFLGGTVVVENKPGAGGATGAAEVARARPDGYTLLAGTSTTQVINPAAMSKPPYDAERDFAPVQIISTTPTSIVVNANFPAKDLRELVAVLKANPGKHSYGSAGQGTITNLTGELFKSLGGNLDMLHVPYKGAGPGLQDVIAGHLPIFTPIFSATVLSHHRAGKIRVLAVNGDARLRAAPEIPTAIEAGMPEMLVQVFNVIVAPAGTPKAVLDALSDATTRAKADPAFIADVEKAGAQMVADSNPEKAAAYIRAEVKRWTPIIKATGFRIE